MGALKKYNVSLLCFFILAGTANLNIAIAEENLWLYAKGTDTRPKGTTEVKLGTIYKYGKKSADYESHDIRAEVEYGVTDRLTVGAELIFFDHKYEVKDEDLEPYIETQGGLDSEFNRTQFAGYELSTKYNFLSPYKDFIGLSGGLSYEYRRKYRLDGADINQKSYVATIFTQKNFLDDTLIFAFTPKVEFEKRRSPGVKEDEIALDIAAGVSYRIKPRWFVGMEFRHQSDYLNPREDGEYDPNLERSKFFSDFQVGSQHQAGNYLGPTVHYAQERWWVTAGALHQIKGHGNAPGVNNDGGRNYDEHERWHFGLTYGYEFGKKKS